MDMTPRPDASGHVPRAQRRVCSLLYCNVVGFSVMAERLAPDALDVVLTEYLEAVASGLAAHGGRVVSAVNDRLLVSFERPTHPLDAVQAAAAAQGALRVLNARRREEGDEPLQVAMGVNTGEVSVTVIPGATVETLLGDTVDVVERLQSVAVPGEVLVGLVTKLAASPGVPFEDLGPMQCKGRRRTLQAFRLRAAF